MGCFWVARAKPNKNQWPEGETRQICIREKTKQNKTNGKGPIIFTTEPLERMIKESDGSAF